MSGGVPFSDLRCPTCRSEFAPTMRWESTDEGYLTDSLFAAKVVTPRIAYLQCAQGHQWSVKTIYRRINREDEVLLDRLVGECGRTL